MELPTCEGEQLKIEKKERKSLPTSSPSCALSWVLVGFCSESFLFEFVLVVRRFGMKLFRYASCVCPSEYSWPVPMREVLKDR